jgi:LPXTG-motif cell wall-anchored protein
MNTLAHIFLILLQIPQNIDVNDSGDLAPLTDASNWMLGFIILLLVAVGYYFLVYRKRK